MSALGESLGNSAAPHVFTQRDKDGKVIRQYQMRLIDDYVKSELEKRLYERARFIVRSMREDLTEKQYLKMLRMLARDYQIGEFSPFTSERGQEYLQSVDGAIQLASLLFNCSDSEVISLMSNQNDEAEIKSLISVVMQESFPTIDFKKMTEEKNKESRENEKDEKDKLLEDNSNGDKAVTSGRKKSDRDGTRRSKRRGARLW